MLADSSFSTERSAWSIADDVIYLNHGSFGPAPRVVQAAREEWSRRLNANPMDFYLRQFDALLEEAAGRLGELVGADARDLVFIDNATVAMNVVAESLSLGPDDEVLLNDHEYGAVFRIWRHACERVGARIVSPTLGHQVQVATTDNTATPLQKSEARNGSDNVRDFRSAAADIIEPILAAITPRTKLIVVSHVTSPTGIVFPVAELGQAAHEQGIPVCIDGPHAIAMRDIDLKQIDCDFYCASLHKWLSAPFGSGFLYVHRRRQRELVPHLVSWGRSLGGCFPRWQDQLNWLGTRDPAPFLAVPAAIDFLEQAGLDLFRQQTHGLARSARRVLEATLGRTATIPDSIDWYGSMIAVPLPKPTAQENEPAAQKKRTKSPPNAIHPLQQWLWEKHRIEVLVTECHGQSYLRISCHLYNTMSDIEALAAALSNYWKTVHAP